MKRKQTERPGIVRQAIEARSELDRWLARRDYREQIVTHYLREMGTSYPGTPDDLAEKWRLSLRVGEVYAVGQEMFDVITQAGTEFPDDLVVEHHHLHAEHGFLWLPRLIVEPIGAPPAFLSWHNGTGWSDRKRGLTAGIEINLWGRSERGMPFPCGSDFLPYGLPALGWRVHHNGVTTVEEQETALSNSSRFVLALQLLMRQELPALDRWDIPRSDVAGLRRADLPLSPVNVVSLRRRKTRPVDHEPVENGRHLDHRQMVRGHWQGYWVGPNHPQHPGGTEEKVKIWLYRSLYIRGPEGTPLVLPRERVHTVTR